MFPVFYNDDISLRFNCIVLLIGVMENRCFHYQDRVSGVYTPLFMADVMPFFFSMPIISYNNNRNGHQSSFTLILITRWDSSKMNRKLRIAIRRMHVRMLPTMATNVTTVVLYINHLSANP